MKYLQKHGSLVGREVRGQDIPEPDNDPVTSMETTVVYCVLPENNADKGSTTHSDGRLQTQAGMEFRQAAQQTLASPGDDKLLLSQKFMPL